MYSNYGQDFKKPGALLIFLIKKNTLLTFATRKNKLELLQDEEE